MADGAIRIGIVGAGGIVRSRNLPGLRAMPGVEVVSVVNRSRESSERAAAEMEIPTVYDNWTDLIESSDTNAICIGTWPYMHCAMTLAALEADKHVLTEGRMAMNADEARIMLDAARSKPHLITQIVPGPPTFPVDNVLIEMINSGFLGDVLSVDIRALPIGRQPHQAFINPDAPFHWRMDADVSGYNALSVGIEYESMMRWLGPATKVMGNTRTFTTQRRDEDGNLRSVRLPELVGILADLACGAQMHMNVSSISGMGPQHEIWLFGSQGTVHCEGANVFAGKRGDTELKEVPNPEASRYKWRAEEEFINAIRGVGKSHPHPLRRRRTVHGVQRGSGPQLPNRRSNIPAPVDPQHFHTGVDSDGTLFTQGANLFQWEAQKPL